MSDPPPQKKKKKEKERESVGGWVRACVRVCVSARATRACLCEGEHLPIQLKKKIIITMRVDKSIVFHAQKLITQAVH